MLTQRASLTLIAFAATLAASPALAAAPGAGWQQGRSEDSPAVLIRKLDNVTVEYHVVIDDNDWIKTTVDPCGDSRWYIKDSIDPPGANTAERAAGLRKLIEEDLHNAVLNCPVAADLPRRMLEGFEPAWSQFEVLKSHAQTH